MVLDQRPPLGQLYLKLAVTYYATVTNRSSAIKLTRILLCFLLDYLLVDK